MNRFFCNCLVSVVILFALFQISCSFNSQSSKVPVHGSIEDWIHWPSETLMLSNDWEMIPKHNIFEIDSKYLLETVSLLDRVSALQLSKAQFGRYTNKNTIAVKEHWGIYLVRRVWTANCKMNCLSKDEAIWIRCGSLGGQPGGFTKKPCILLLPFRPINVYVDYQEVL